MISPVRTALLFCLTFIFTGAVVAQEPLSIGANVNMVSGTAFPNGDPFQRQQNEPSVAFSSRNSLHLLAGANDYRAVDVPGLPGGRETGDSWLSYFWSTNGGATWESTLMPGYPQDPACLTANRPVLCDYAAGADPVVRAGVNGMFYYSGIVFDRSEPSRSAIFVSRFIDLNNDEGGDPIRYLDTTIIDANSDGSVFLDKSWIGVDIPRETGTSPITDTLSVVQSDSSVVEQTVACGNVYVGYAAIGGEGDNLRSEIRMATSADCGNSWDIQPISQPDSLNQGANIAIDPLTGQLHVVWRRFDTVETFLGISPTGCPASPASWEINDDWPVDTITLGGDTYTVAQAQELLGRKHRGDESIKLAYEVIAAKLNLLTGGGDPVDGFNPWLWSEDLSGLIDDAEAYFAVHPIGSDPKQRDKKAGQNIKKNIQSILQGSGTCSDGGTTTTTSTTGETNAIMAVTSDDFGQTFSDPVVINESTTFDQPSSRFTFRTTAFPTVAADTDGRIYAAWSARGFASIRGDELEGDARIVVSTSSNGIHWSLPTVVDEPADNPDPQREGRGHQIKPSLLFAGGKLTLVFYDFREDVSSIFEALVVDLPLPGRLRHSVDVRVATALPADVPQFTDYSLLSNNEPAKPSSQTSRYAFVTTDAPSTVQLEYMVPNLPMFADGTTPFIGDYVDVAAPNLINENGTWRFATNPGDVQVWQAVWSDNRNVIPPPDGDWGKYVAPIAVAQPSQFDPTVVIPSCNDVNFPGAVGFEAGAFYTGTRNQNVYSATLSSGVIVAAPGNNRPLGFDALGAPLKRGFVVYIQNTTAQERSFEVSLANTPIGIEASLALNETIVSKDVTIPAYSSAVATVFASLEPGSTPISETIPVLVQEIGGTLQGSVVLNSDPSAPEPRDGSLLSGEIHNPQITNPVASNLSVLDPEFIAANSDVGACGTDPDKCVLNPAVLNPAVLNPAVFNPAVLNPAVLNPAVFNPAVLNPAVFNPAVFNPAVFNPAVFNPAVLNPAVFNPAVLNPAVLNPAVFNPAVLNPAVLNPAVLNPAVFNPAVLNPAVLNPAVLNPAVLNSAPSGTDPQQVDVTFAVTNDGNATTAYNLDLAAPQIEGLDYDLIVFRLNETPITDGCTLTTEAQQQLIFNQTDPLNTTGDGSFYLEPGEQVFVTFRVRPDVESPTPADPVTTFDSDVLSAVVEAQPLNTDPMTQPPADQFGPPISCDIAGDWSGTFLQFATTYPLVVNNLSCATTPGSVIADVEYTSLGCSGTWTLDGIMGDTLMVTESLNTVGTSCQTGWQYDVTLNGTALEGVSTNFSGSFRLFQVDNSPFTETIITDDSSILNDGFLVAANDLGVNPNGVTVNGVNFNTSQGGLLGPWGPGSGDFSVDPFSTNLDALLSDLQFSGTLNPVSLTIDGLTAGTDYRLQLLFSNDLNSTGDRVEVTVEGETWVLDDWQPNAINLIANFTASAPSVVVTIAPGLGSTGESGRAVLNGYVIHEAPFVAVNTGSVSNVSLAGNTAAIGSGVPLSYTADLGNSTTATLQPVIFQTYIDQPGASRAAGGFVVNCFGAAGVPPGGCSIGGSLGASNGLAAGFGTLVAGPAAARFDLVLGNSSATGVVLDRFTVPITLTDPAVTTPLITAATPDPMAPGFGQFVTFTILNAPGLIRNVDTVFARNEVTGVTSSNNFIYGGTTVRLDDALRPVSGNEAATVWVEYGNGDRSNDFAMTFRSTPAAPIINAVNTAQGCFNFVGAPIDAQNDTVLGGDWLRITAQALDTATSRVDVRTTQASSMVSTTQNLANICPSTDGANYWVQIPAGVTADPFTLEIRANQSPGGGPGDFATIALNQ